MKILFENGLSQNLDKKTFPLFVLGVSLILPLMFILKTMLGYKGLILLLGLLIGVFSIYSFSLSFAILLILLFTPYIVAYHTAVLYSFFIFLSFLVNFKGELKKEIILPIYIPFLIYFLTTLPSFINTPLVGFSIIESSNLFAFFIVSFTTFYMINTSNKMYNTIYFFLFGVLVHSIIVIFLGLSTGKRVFGLLDVFYVDLAGLGGLISFILMIFSRGSKKFLFGILFVVITYGLILTQTRNAWVSFSFAFFSFILYLMIKAPALNIKRSSLITNTMISVIILGSIFLISSGLTSNIQERLEVKAQTTEIVDQDPNTLAENSLVTRFLIWHTAANAFIEHPIIGIGLYSFKYTSKLYYTIPKSFYKIFVEHRTPHVTYLEVLTETGILGFIGFVIFIFALIKYNLKSLKLIEAVKDRPMTLIIVWSFIYIIFSMFMTEAWLYGQYIVWMGVMVGLLLSNFSLNKNKHEKSPDAVR